MIRMNAAGSLLYGIGNLLHPRMLWLMVWPMENSLTVWNPLGSVRLSGLSKA